MTIAGIAAVSVIAGQEQARQQGKLQQPSQNLAVHTEAPDQTAAPQDTVTLSGSQPQTSDTFSLTRYLQPENLRAIAAYEAIQPGIRLEHPPDSVSIEEEIVSEQPMPPGLVALAQHRHSRLRQGWSVVDTQSPGHPCN